MLVRLYLHRAVCKVVEKFRLDWLPDRVRAPLDEMRAKNATEDRGLQLVCLSISLCVCSQLNFAVSSTDLHVSLRVILHATRTLVSC